MSIQVVVYFYGSDGSPSCTKQAKAFKEAMGSFQKKGAKGGPHAEGMWHEYLTEPRINTFDIPARFICARNL